MIAKYVLICIFISALKLSFYESYVSTDFEVHRNWKAITNSLPLKEWYIENTSQWTLDYPPFFAWFEYSLSQVGRLFDANMTKVENLNYISQKTKLFQKLSVIVSDFVYMYSVLKIICCKPVSKCLTDSLYFILTTLKVLAPFSLLLIDHIHFQYNGILFGILLLSVYHILKKNELVASFWFAVLLNMKHIYIYYAPAFGVYLLMSYCFPVSLSEPNKKRKFVWRNFFKLAAVVANVFIFSFGPFIVMGQFYQVLSRLFPFDERGLTHAYWAPNIWALYNTLDLGLMKSGYFEIQNMDGMTRGLVEGFSHAVLPSIRPFQTAALTLLFLVPALLKICWKLTTKNFLKLLIISGWSAFTFGWHVHEKAVLMVTIPFMILELFEPQVAIISFALSTVAHFSLLPLIPTIPEYLLKCSLFMACTITHYVQANYVAVGANNESLSYTTNVWKCLPMTLKFTIGVGLPLVWLMADFAMPLFTPRLKFLPLLLYSVICAVGLLDCLIRFYVYFWTDDIRWISAEKEKLKKDSKTKMKTDYINNREKKCQ